MRAYHVTSIKKLRKYLVSGFIKPPVRMWVDLQRAEQFAEQIGRSIILLINLGENDTIYPLKEHGGKAIVMKDNLKYLEDQTTS